MPFIAKLFICPINSASVKWNSANSEFKSGNFFRFKVHFVSKVVVLFNFQFLIVDFQASLLIFSKKRLLMLTERVKKL